jgi:poly-gamma-glutamate synthesis protein (capsule biosynthesis protein)
VLVSGRGRGAAAVTLAAWLLVGCGPADRTTLPTASTHDAPRASEPAEPTKTAAPSPAPRPSAAPDAPVFTSSISPIAPELAARMSASWHPGCPVDLADLRYLTVTHHGFADGEVAQGELVVHADVADGVVAVFRAIFDAGYPIRSMRLVDDYGGSDDASMAADNTSAFNCRAITGGPSWSQHSYGNAIDVNPVQNPYVSGSSVQPAAGRSYLNRSAVRTGMIRSGDVVDRAFTAAGWRWGGRWSSPKDYQHFSSNNR